MLEVFPGYGGFYFFVALMLLGSLGKFSAGLRRIWEAWRLRNVFDIVVLKCGCLCDFRGCRGVWDFGVFVVVPFWM